MEVIREEQNGITIANIVGRVDAATSKALEEQIMPIIDEGGHQLLIDCSKLDYISSAGLRVFLMAAKKVQMAKGKIVLTGMQQSIKTMFDIAGFSALFPILDTREAGIGELGG